MSNKSAVILFGHGARDPAWARPLERIAEKAAQQERTLLVRLAFLEFLAPSLPQAIDELAGAGVARIAVVPVFMSQSGHVARDVPAMLAAARHRHPSLCLSLAAPVGEADPVLSAMAAYAVAAVATGDTGDTT